MKYMIHACPERMWYVEGLLKPSMIAQGIRAADITVWNDQERRGNLQSCLDSFGSLRGIPGGTWHLQDDVLVSRDFAEQTERFGQDRVVCGFCYSGYEQGTPITGQVFPALMWNSTFPCVYIPNGTAADFADWFCQEARGQPEYAAWISTGKMDDTFFHAYMVEKHPDEMVLNLAPHLVEHVDYIIGGSSINKWRGHICRGYYFDDEELVKELTEKVVKLKNRREATTLKA